MAQIEQEIKPFDFSHAKECAFNKRPTFYSFLVQLDEENSKLLVDAIRSGVTDFTVRSPEGSVRISWQKPEEK